MSARYGCFHPVIEPEEKEGGIMSTLARRLYVLLVSIVLTLGLARIPAHAASVQVPESGIANAIEITAVREGCEATHYHNVTRHGKTLRVYIRYYASGGGTNCAWVEKTTDHGTREDIGIRMAKCAPGNFDGASSCPVDGGWASQIGWFWIYAGPVWRSGTSGRCLWIQIAYRSPNVWSNAFPVHHCG